MGLRVSARIGALVLPLALATGACIGHMDLTGKATDEWTHSYDLAPGGEIHIGNTNGKVEFEGIDGSKVEIRAERIARGVSDESARELLDKIEIREDAKPDRISVVTGRISGIMIGASIEVRYHVKAPKNALIDATNTNGQILLTGMTGRVTARTTNGGVVGRNLTGGVDATSTNGSVNIELASIGPDRISLRTTNGGVTLTVPENAKADVTATCTNGGIQFSGVKMEVSAQSRRKLEGKLNGGGTPIELHTTNGGVRLRSRSDAPEPRT
jgi:DUF4097 and DUF4098 domain-containing protein YvlB